MSVNELFTEKFRPKKLSQLIAPQRVKSELSKGLIQNLLLYGSAGTGKTSSLFILAENHTSLYINASSERGIDIIREKIAEFCSTMGNLIDGEEELKCVILDEIDGATDDFFKALRAVMERYHNVARFIASCNHIEKLPDAIKSRFNRISYDPTQAEEPAIIEEYEKRIGTILTAAKISYTPEVLRKFVITEFPDMRALMNKVQSLYLQGVKELDPAKFFYNKNYQELLQLCMAGSDKPYDNYKVVMSGYATKVDEALITLGEDLPEFIRNNHPNKLDKLPLVLIALAKYQYQKAFAIDSVVTLLAAIFELQTILK